jgi:hypothetical protein
MKTERFHAKGNRSDNLLHIETDGCVVNIQVGLRDDKGRPITRVDVLADSEWRGGDGQGNNWHAEVGMHDGDGWHKTGPPGYGAAVRVVRQAKE